MIGKRMTERKDTKYENQETWEIFSKGRKE